MKIKTVIVKKILIISIMLIIFSIGAVSASDNTTHDSIIADNSTVTLDENNISNIETNPNWSLSVEEDIELLPAPNQAIEIRNIGYTTGNISFSVDDVEQNITVGYRDLYYDYFLYFEFDASKLSCGKHNYMVNFTGDEYLPATTKSGTLTISPIILDVSSDIYLYSTYDNSREDLDNRGYIKITYLKNMTEKLYLYINGVKKTIDLSDINAKGDIGSVYNGYSCYVYNYKKYKLINYDKQRQCYVYREYYDFYEPTNITMICNDINRSAFVNVSYEVDCYSELVKGNNLEIFIPKEISDKTSVEIDGKRSKLYSSKFVSDYTRMKFYVKTSKLNFGAHSIKINTPLYNMSKTINIVDEPVSPKKVYIYYSDTRTLTFTIYGEGRNALTSGEYVDMRIDSVFETSKITKKGGKVSFKVPKSIKPGTYVLNFKSYSDPQDIHGKVKLVIKHVVTLKSMSVKKSARKLTLQATLKKVNGKYLKNKVVTFKFNGKTFQTKTNSKGVAKVTVPKSFLNTLKAGKKITYHATYLKDTVKKTVKVLK